MSVTPVVVLRYLVVNIKPLDSSLVSLDEVARITELDPDEIEWGIERVGRCDTADWAILPEGAAYTPYLYPCRRKASR